VRLEVYTSKEVMIQAAERYKSLLSQGQRLLEERLVFRQKTAANVQQMRYKDMAFRVFRNDALEKYRAQFDMAAAYVYMAAKAYDYDTALAEGTGDILERIVRSRAIGEISGGQPIASQNGGDGGLADAMAMMQGNWMVLRGALGYNQLRKENRTFSLRQEFFRIPTGAKYNATWRETLQRHVVPNLREIPDVRRFCKLPSGTSVEPGIVIPFSTVIEDGMNFFGWDYTGGDHRYTAAVFATNLRTSGVFLSSYPRSALGTDPYVYLVPLGNDRKRTPDGTIVREWKVLEQVLPVPFQLSGTPTLDSTWIPANNTVQGALDEFSGTPNVVGNETLIRRFASFEASYETKLASASTSSRLIGRSAWNTRWILVIRGRELLGDPIEGLQRFINGSLVSGQRDGNGVTDLMLTFDTYTVDGF
jgi:hypothetical protein